MATLGEACRNDMIGWDNSVFFFQVQLLSEHAIPIGFVKIPVAVNYFSWDDMSGKVLLSLGDGSLLALSSPNLDTVNNSETYEIEVNYTAVMPDVPEIEESDEEEEEEEEGEAQEGEEGEASPTATEAPTEAEGEEEEGKKKKKKKKEEKPKDDDDDEEKHVEVVVTSVSRAIFIPGDSDDSERKVIFTGTGKYSGGLWEGSMVGVEETRISEVPLTECLPQTVSCLLRSKIPQNVQVTHLSLSPALNWIILGFADGRVWLVPRVHGGTFACVHVSDGMSGAVNSVSMLEDESMMLVAAGDGSLVTFLVSDGVLELSEIKAQGKEVNMADAGLELENAIPEMPDMSMEGWSLPPKETPGVLAINPDITDAEQYSIQDAKLKAEEDSAKAAAELKKLRNLADPNRGSGEPRGRGLKRYRDDESGTLPPLLDFYNEQLEDDFRKSRYLDLARKDGMPVGKVERQLSEGKVPAVTFTFVNVGKKGINEDCVQQPRNTEFMMAWLPTFAVDPPTELEAKEALYYVGEVHCLAESKDLEDWALEESRLHRLMAAKVLANFSRTPTARKPGSNMQKLKSLLSLIFKDSEKSITEWGKHCHLHARRKQVLQERQNQSEEEAQKSKDKEEDEEQEVLVEEEEEEESVTDDEVMEVPKKAEDSKEAEEERKKAEDAKKAEEERQKAEDAKKAAEAEEERKKAEDAKKAEEERQKAEDAKKAAEAEENRKKAEDAKKAKEERKKAEDAKKAAEAEEERKKAEDAKKAEEERQKAEDAKKAAEAEEERKKAEDAKKAEEERQKAEDAKKAAEAEENREKAEDAKKAKEERKKAKDAKKTAEAEEERKKAEDAKKAQEERQKAEDAKKIAEAEEEKKKAKDAKKAEEERIHRKKGQEETAKEWERKKKAVEDDGGAMAVATGLTFQLYDALKMLGDSPEHQQFKSEVLCFLSGQKEAERPNTEDLEANSDDDTHGQGAKGTYKDTMALNPELPKLPEDLRDSADSPKTERASQLLQDQREIRAKRKAQLQAKEAEPKKRGRPPKTEKGKEESKEESKEDKKEEEQDELSMENALDKDDQELRVERALEDDDNDAKPRRRSTTKGSGRGGKKRKGPDGKTKGKEPGPENEQEATEGKTEEKPGSAKEAEETTKKPDKDPDETPPPNKRGREDW
ncbi:unnamed protein product [Cladocopium goreaui]|uniref:Flagellar attachment zone protein 1 n=1 Tax=Cladocopium goreaui TaxID=2562237 RepID=A0A9P1C9E2_9DINO|nr:unnamed protein product [Cladocopium goreaui]